MNKDKAHFTILFEVDLDPVPGACATVDWWDKFAVNTLERGSVTYNGKAMCTEAHVEKDDSGSLVSAHELDRAYYFHVYMYLTHKEVDLVEIEAELSELAIKAIEDGHLELGSEIMYYSLHGETY
jgi:hypothetical protein